MTFEKFNKMNRMIRKLISNNSPEHPVHPVKNSSPLAAALILSAVTFAVGCNQGSDVPRFPHDKHAELGIACADCHETGGKLPTLETCKTCHSEALETVTPEQVEKIMAVRASDSPAYGLAFDHSKHSGLECADCHKTANGKMSPPSMDFCMTACHGPVAMAPLTCEKCHTDLDPVGRPANHSAGWKRGHGPTAYADATTCKSCHTEESCFSCHRTVKPENHNQHFRLRGHGVIASADRERCASCHRQDFCVQCHLRSKPITHTTAWNSSTTRTHCTNCHVPLSVSSCAVCHMEANHGTAAAVPSVASGHVDPANVADCRVCHGAGLARLPHPDSGDHCGECHQ